MVRPADAPLVFATLLDQLVEMYEGDPLRAVFEHARERYGNRAVPAFDRLLREYGSLDLEEVRRSLYAFD